MIRHKVNKDSEFSLYNYQLHKMVTIKNTNNMILGSGLEIDFDLVVFDVDPYSELWKISENCDHRINRPYQNEPEFPPYCVRGTKCKDLDFF